MSQQEPSTHTHLRLKVTKCFHGVKQPVLQVCNTTQGHAGRWDGWEMPAPTTTDPSLEGVWMHWSQQHVAVHPPGHQPGLAAEARCNVLLCSLMSS